MGYNISKGRHSKTSQIPRGVKLKGEDTRKADRHHKLCDYIESRDKERGIDPRKTYFRKF